MQPNWFFTHPVIFCMPWVFSFGRLTIPSLSSTAFAIVNRLFCNPSAKCTSRPGWNSWSSMPAASAASSMPILRLAARAVPMAGESPYESRAPVVLKISATALRTDGWVLTHFSERRRREDWL